MQNHFFHIEGVIGAIGTVVTVWGVVKAVGAWAYHGVNAFKAQSKFVQDMATNHLPHIYESLNHISFKLGEEPKPAPPIRFPVDDQK